MTEKDAGTMFGPKLKMEQYKSLQCGQDLFQDRWGILISSRTGMGMGTVPLPVGTCFRICIEMGSVPVQSQDQLQDRCGIGINSTTGMMSGSVKVPVMGSNQFQDQREFMANVNLYGIGSTWVQD